MSERQDVAAAAKQAGWHTNGTDSGKGFDAYDLPAPDDDSPDQRAEVSYGPDGQLTEFWVNDRSFGDAQTVGLAAHAVAFFAGGQPQRGDGEPDTMQPWDEETGGPRGGTRSDVVADAAASAHASSAKQGTAKATGTAHGARPVRGRAGR